MQKQSGITTMCEAYTVILYFYLYYLSYLLVVR